MSNTRIYHIWTDMKTRCNCTNSNVYRLYGGRGIKSDKYKFFIDFYDDLFDSYIKHCKEYGVKNTTLDRIDVNGNYEPSNCRWVTLQEQNNNRRSNRLITYRGKTQNLTQWCKELNIKRSAFYCLLEKGYSDVDAIGALLGFTKEQLDNAVKELKKNGSLVVGKRTYYTQKGYEAVVNK